MSADVAALPLHGRGVAEPPSPPVEVREPRTAPHGHRIGVDVTQASYLRGLLHGVRAVIYDENVRHRLSL